MSRNLKVSVSAINITTHPHSPQLYIQLFDEIYKKESKIKLRGTDWGMLGYLDRSQNTDFISGTILKFLNLDPNEPWLNLKTLKEVDPDANKPIIPDHLKPHLRFAEFVFFPDGHRLFYDSKRISSSMIQRFFQGLFNDVDLIKQYGDISVSVESDQEGINQILELSRRAYIDIFVRRPNADDLSHLKARVLQRLGDQNASTLNEVWKAPRGGNLTPDEETKSLMEMALSNGHLKAVGYTAADERVEIFSEQHPIKQQVEFDKDNETIWTVLAGTGRTLLSVLRKRG